MPASQYHMLFVLTLGYRGLDHGLRIEPPVVGFLGHSLPLYRLLYCVADGGGP